MSQYTFRINGNEYNVDINSVDGDNATVTVNGIQYFVESGVAACAQAAKAAPAPVAAAQAPIAAPAAPAPAPQAAPAPQPAAAPAAPKPAAPAAGKGKAVTSPLPGVIIEISVNVGDAVKMGQQVAVLEAMKMENAIEASQDGTVTAIHVAKGDSVLEGAPIVTIG